MQALHDAQQLTLEAQASAEAGVGLPERVTQLQAAYDGAVADSLGMKASLARKESLLKHAHERIDTLQLELASAEKRAASLERRVRQTVIIFSK